MMASRAATSRVDFRSPLPGALLRCLRVCTTSQILADLRLSSPNLPSHGTQQSIHATPRVGCSERDNDCLNLRRERSIAGVVKLDQYRHFLFILLSWEIL